MPVFGIDIGEFTTYHLCNNLLRSHVFRSPGAYIGSVSHDADVIGNALNFIHLVGDVNHGYALLL